MTPVSGDVPPGMRQRIKLDRMGGGGGGFTYYDIQGLCHSNELLFSHETPKLQFSTKILRKIPKNDLFLLKLPKNG